MDSPGLESLLGIDSSFNDPSSMLMIPRTLAYVAIAVIVYRGMYRMDEQK
jgi:hypothetical protein